MPCHLHDRLTTARHRAQRGPGPVSKSASLRAAPATRLPGAPPTMGRDGRRCRGPRHREPRFPRACWCAGRNVPAVSLDVGEDGSGTGVDDRQAVATQVDSGTRTSSPTPTSRASNGTCSADLRGGMAQADVPGELGLELADRLSSVAAPVVGYRFGHITDFETGDPRSGNRDSVGRSVVDRSRDIRLAGLMKYHTVVDGHYKPIPS